MGNFFGGGGGTLPSPLTRVDGNTIAQSNGATGQTLLVYNTVDNVLSPTNYERLTLGWNSGQSNFRIGAEKGGTGTLRQIDFVSAQFGFINSGGSRAFIIGNAGTIIQYENAATAGKGFSVTKSSARSVAQTAAVGSVATFTPSADSTLIVSANVLVTTSTTHTFTVTCAYTDEGNTARTLTMSFMNVAGGTPVTSIANAAGAVPYMGIPVQIRVKASTAVTIATTGTFTTVTYNVEGLIQQIA